MTVTFVTCYFKIYEDEYDSLRSFEHRMNFFLDIVNSGINICIITTPEYEKSFSNKFVNVKVIDVFDKTLLPFSNKYFNEIHSCVLPEIRNKDKDTEYYMYLINSKIEFVKKAIDVNPFSSDYFCWFDFSLSYIFKDMTSSINKLKQISQQTYIDTFLTMPGCWNHAIQNVDILKKQVCWRFCGGFFMGDTQSLLHFYELSVNNYGKFLNQTNTLVWEVNFWAWLETHTTFNPLWYYANHDDGMIINFPTHQLCINN